MKFRQLGSSDLVLSEVGLGCNAFGARIDAARTTSVVSAALASGVNFFDTADIYGDHQSETFLGRALGTRRKDVIIATKFGMFIGDDRDRGGASQRWIMEAVENSLKRLGCDHIDLYQLHQPDPRIPLEETLRALDDLITQGKVRHIGCSNFSAALIEEARLTTIDCGTASFVATQSEYSLLARDAAQEILPVCEKFNLGLLPYFPLGSGLLTGKYRRGAPPPPESRLSRWLTPNPPPALSRKIDLVERLADWAQKRGHTILELAIAWLLASRCVTSVIAGATSAEQVCANAKASRFILNSEELSELAAMLESW
jgi:aryl-alcohol dehydrogenase-like predicted oxidoreductase